MFPVNCSEWYSTTWTLIRSNWISPFVRVEHPLSWTLPHSCSPASLSAHPAPDQAQKVKCEGSSLTWNQTEPGDGGWGWGHYCAQRHPAYLRDGSVSCETLHGTDPLLSSTEPRNLFKILSLIFGLNGCVHHSPTWHIVLTLFSYSLAHELKH